MPKALTQALADLQAAIDAVRKAEAAAQLPPEPANGRIVKFGHRFDADGKRYSYAAIRADHYRGEHRWFITSNDHFPQGGHRGIASPATWAELVAFAIPGTLMVAPLINHWTPPGPPPVGKEGVRIRGKLSDGRVWNIDPVTFTFDEEYGR